MTTQQLAGWHRASPVSRSCCRPRATSSTRSTSSTTGRRRGSRSSPARHPALVAWLESMRFMLRVEVADVTADWAVLGEPLGAESVQGEPLAWVDPWPALVGDTAAYGPVEGHPGRAGLARAGRAAGRLEAALGDRPLAGTWAAEALRVAAWRPRLGLETDHRTIPHEVDWLRTAVHLHKGCYRGQETVARVHNLGRPPRRIVFLHLDGSGHVLPDAGAPVVLGEREVGRLTSVARHYEDGPVALAVVKRRCRGRGSSRRGSRRADRRRHRLSAADPGGWRRCHDGRMAPRPPPVTGTLITVAPTGAEHAKADVPQLPTTLDELVDTAVRAGGRCLAHPPARARRGARARPSTGPAAGGGRRRARGPTSSSSSRPAGRCTTRSRRGSPCSTPSRTVLADLRHDELRRRRVPQPVGVHERPLRAGAGARGRRRVRAVRPRPRARAAAAARHARPALRRPGARRLRHRGARAGCRPRRRRSWPACRCCRTR